MEPEGNYQVLTDEDYLLRKYPGKGGWTYITIPSLDFAGSGAFGFLRVQGSIDDFLLKDAGLWKSKEGGFFLPVKAAIRKAIGKEAGDTVHLKLYTAKNEALQSAAEIELCLREESAAWKRFKALGDTEKQDQVNWVLAGKTEQERIERVADLINKLLSRKKLKGGN